MQVIRTFDRISDPIIFFPPGVELFLSGWPVSKTIITSVLIILFIEISASRFTFHSLHT